MIDEFVKEFDKNREILAAKFAEKHPDSYREIVKNVIEVIKDADDRSYGNPDPERIHEIDDGHYQGTLVYVIAENGYQPHDYWYVKVGYGSCSGCDTLQAINGYSGDPPTPEQVKDYMGLALNVLQGLKKMGDE
jgi:hypothetical protein